MSEHGRNVPRDRPGVGRSEPVLATIVRVIGFYVLLPILALTMIAYVNEWTYGDTATILGLRLGQWTIICTVIGLIHYLLQARERRLEKERRDREAKQ